MKKTLILTLIIFTGFQSFAQKKSKGISFSLQVGSENEIDKTKTSSWYCSGSNALRLYISFLGRFWK